MVGYVSGVYGVWRSDSSAAAWASLSPTWTNIGTYPLGVYDFPRSITGDMNRWGWAYMSWIGNGMAYYRP